MFASAISGFPPNLLPSQSMVESTGRLYIQYIMPNAKKFFDRSTILSKIVDRSKNFFALGLMYWMSNRPVDSTIDWLGSKFGGKPEIAEANIRVLKAGWNYGETTEIFNVRYQVGAAKLPAGKYQNITGNQATAWGMMAAARKAKLDL